MRVLQIIFKSGLLLWSLMVFSNNPTFGHEITHTERGLNPFSPKVIVVYFNQKADTAKCTVSKETGGVIGVEEKFLMNGLATMEIKIPYNHFIEMAPAMISCQPTSLLSRFKNEKLNKEPVKCLQKKYGKDELYTCRANIVSSTQTTSPTAPSPSSVVSAELTSAQREAAELREK